MSESRKKQAEIVMKGKKLTLAAIGSGKFRFSLPEVRGEGGEWIMFFGN
jgi:hypothetical protein